MALKIVTGGTTGAANGTLVSGGNPIVFTALDTPVDAHIRADDDTYAAPAQFVAATTAGPAVGKGDIQISVDGGSTWKSWSDNPYSLATGVGAGPDLGDLNFPIKLRQHAAAPPGDTSGSFDTDGTLASATALGDVTGFTVTPGSTQNALSWTAVTNRTAYRIDRALDSGFTSGVALDISPGQTTTSFTDTGRTNGTTYYYRIKAVGTVRYKDSANYATGNGTAGKNLSALVLSDTDLLYFWKLGETSGAFADSKGSANSSAIGAGITQGSTGIVPSDATLKAATFTDVSTAHADFGSIADFAGTPAFTFVTIVRLTDLTNSMHLGGNNVSAGGVKGWRAVVLSTGKSYMDVYDSGGSSDAAIGTTTIVINKTYLLAYVRTGTTLMLYVYNLTDGTGGIETLSGGGTTVASTRSMAAGSGFRLGYQLNGSHGMVGKQTFAQVYGAAKSAGTLAALAAEAS